MSGTGPTSADNPPGGPNGIALTSSPGRITPERPAEPPTIPDHELLGFIGGGSYGDVWLARNVLGTFRAVKVVYRQAFEHDRPFEREFEGIQKFEPVSRRHESQLDILHVGRNDAAGYFYYVMELADDAAEGEIESKLELRGEGQSPSNALTQHSTQDALNSYIPHTLKHELNQRGRLPFNECLRIGLALTTALEHLHQHGLVHRDIKPSNIIFVNGQPKLADIGLVAAMDATMSFVGTAGFVPPEGPGTAQADIYSLGKVLYEMSMGRDRQEFPKLPQDLDETTSARELVELNAVLLKACEADSRRRYTSVVEMREDLQRLVAGKSVKRAHARQRWLTVGRKVLVGLAGLALVVLGLHTATKSLDNGPQDLTQLFAGDDWTALLFHLKALERDRGNPELEQGHRLHIASILPELIQPESTFMDVGDQTHLRFSRDYAKLLTFGSIPSVEVYDRSAGRHLCTLEHKLPVLAAGFNMDSSSIFTLSKDGQARFWQAASGASIAGKHFTEDFRNPPEDWEQCFKAPGDANKFTFANRNGSLRIQVQPRSGTGSVVLRAPLELCADAMVSLDILDWDENAPGQSIGLTARSRGTGWSKGACVGLVTFHDPPLNRRASIGIFITKFLATTAVDVDPEKAYRLEFLIFGSEAHLFLFELDNGEVGELIASRSVANSPTLNSGRFGIWAKADSGKNAYDVTVDNFSFVGIQP